MILTEEDLQAIGQLIDQKVNALEGRVDVKLGEIRTDVKSVSENVDLMAKLLNLKEIMENSRVVSLNLGHKIHEANK